MATPKSVAFYTLGCKLNYSETSAIGRLFEDAGYHENKFNDGADIYVINTCSVTDFADRKCRQTVRRALRKSPNAFVVVIGCYAQLKPKEISEIPGVDLVLGAAEKFKILNYIDDLSKSPSKGMVHAGEVKEAYHFKDAFSFGDRTRSFLKVQDGCDYKCSFCTIPLARGKSRSDSIENVLANAQRLADMGSKEIVLTGVNIGDFGLRPTSEGSSESVRKNAFIDLIKELDQIDSVERFRISSIEPNLCSDEIIEFVAKSKRFVPHFHMPLQSGSDKILKLMRRRYKKKLYEERVEKIKSLMPHCCIGVDVIVGFPGETDDDFLETYNFLNELDITYLHVFTYSERANTLAAEMSDSVGMNTRKKRNEMLTLLSEKKKEDFYRKYLNQTRPVLFEKSKEEGKMSGFTDNYIRTEMPLNESMLNTTRPAKLIKINEKGLVEAAIQPQFVL